MSAFAQEQPGLRWAGSVGVVLAVHAAVVLAVLWWQARSPAPPRSQPPEAVMVELAPLPTAPPAPPTQLPPGPPQQEQHKAQPKAEAEPTPKPQPPQQHADVALPQQAPAQQSQDSAAEEVAQTSAPPSVPAPVGSQYAASQSLSGSDSHALVNWQSQVLGQLEKFKRYPRVAQRLRQEGVVLVRYTVDRQGRVLSARLANSSGRASLDAEALAAVQRASPLPPPPAEIPGDPVEVTTPVEFFLR